MVFQLAFARNLVSFECSILFVKEYGAYAHLQRRASMKMTALDVSLPVNQLLLATDAAINDPRRELNQNAAPIEVIAAKRFPRMAKRERRAMTMVLTQMMWQNPDLFDWYKVSGEERNYWGLLIAGRLRVAALKRAR